MSKHSDIPSADESYIDYLYRYTSRRVVDRGLGRLLLFFGQRAEERDCFRFLGSKLHEARCNGRLLENTTALEKGVITGVNLTYYHLYTVA